MKKKTSDNPVYDTYCIENFYSEVGHLGGTIKEVPKPHTRYYNKKVKRPVFVKITLFYGIGKHQWVDMNEADNPIWNSKTKKWVQCTDDKQGRGQSFTKQCITDADVIDYVNETFKKKFSDKTHVLVLDRPKGKIKWHYKDGD